MINHQYRCIFIHIPKTGGKSVHRFFGTNWQDHKDISRYAEELTPETFTSYYKFAVVRNPWNRLGFGYNYQKGKKGSQVSNRLFLLFGCDLSSYSSSWVFGISAKRGKPLLMAIE